MKGLDIFFFGLLSINYAAFEVREEYGPGCHQPALLGGTPGGDEGEIWNLVVVMHAGRGAARTFTLGKAPQQHRDEEDGPDGEEDGPKEENAGPGCAPGLCSSPLHYPVEMAALAPLPPSLAPPGTGVS